MAYFALLKMFLLKEEAHWVQSPEPESFSLCAETSILTWCLPPQSLFHYCSSSLLLESEEEKEGEPDSMYDATANFPFYAGSKSCRATYGNIWPLHLCRGRPVWAAAAHPEAEETPCVLPVCLLPWELLPLAAWKRCAAPEAWRSVQ